MFGNRPDNEIKTSIGNSILGMSGMSSYNNYAVHQTIRKSTNDILYEPYMSEPSNAKSWRLRLSLFSKWVSKLNLYHCQQVSNPERDAEFREAKLDLKTKD